MTRGRTRDAINDRINTFWVYLGYSESYSWVSIPLHVGRVSYFKQRQRVKKSSETSTHHPYSLLVYFINQEPFCRIRRRANIERRNFVRLSRSDPVLFGGDK